MTAPTRHHFPDAAPNTEEWRYGLQRNADESQGWRQRRVRSPSAIMWREHKDGHPDGRNSCLFCSLEQRRA